MYSPTCQQPTAFGLLDLKIAAPAFTGTTQNALVDLGSAVDSSRISDRPFYYDIHCDSNGGQHGPPADMQYLGHIVNISLELKTWNDVAIDALRQRSVNAVLGTDAQPEIGTFMLQDRGVRLLLDTQNPLHRRNFWCCIIREPIAIAMGTKWASYQLNFTAYRPPCYHPKAGILEDKDNT